MERVSCIIGKKPIIIVVPHGPDDVNTDLIGELCAKQLNCFAVINRGFDRGDPVDIDKDVADCNRIDHIKEDVIFDEFLKPIIKFAAPIASKSKPPHPWGYGGYWGHNYNYDPVHVFHIHGCGNHVHKEAGEDVEVIIGYGLGAKKDNLTCDEWRKNAVVDLYRKFASDGDVFEGKGGGRYAGRDSNNMNQYFRKHENRPWVHSMQLEYPYSARDSSSKAVTTAMLLAVVLGDYLQYDKYDLVPEAKLI